MQLQAVGLYTLDQVVHVQLLKQNRVMDQLIKVKRLHQQIVGVCQQLTLRQEARVKIKLEQGRIIAQEEILHTQLEVQAQAQVQVLPAHIPAQVQEFPDV